MKEPIHFKGHIQKDTSVASKNKGSPDRQPVLEEGVFTTGQSGFMAYIDA